MYESIPCPVQIKKERLLVSTPKVPLQRRSTPLEPNFHNTSAHLVLWLDGTESSIPQPARGAFVLLSYSTLAVMIMAWWYLVIASSAVWAAYTQAFLDAFSSLGIDPWAGIEMDVAWGHTVLSPHFVPLWVLFKSKGPTSAACGVRGRCG